ncbi:Pre protein translocase subunit Sec66-domain-containing protein [Phascolomyces articulosus]|uniref:Pre protein translocase subunit Sec66-domain-containing protein n=1 Tax=Phascolomyces articulosus TaxID=60185 RepID=A0AAD5K250_9FUNG|nr:Pre protein translocase subunit Sec66-domain-containing protein [Phascolomyces articulosus]
MDTLALPALYLGGCIAAMSVFSFVYRRVTGIKTVEPWFSDNNEKEQYIVLLNTEKPVPEQHLRAALLRRAMEAVRRLVQIQQEKPALQQLMRMGSIGDDLWRDFSVAEQQTMMELQEVSQEANTYKSNWGQTIFSTAAQMLEHEKQKVLQQEMKAMKEAEEKRRLMQEKELKLAEEREQERRLKEAKQAEEDLLKMEEEEQKNPSKNNKNKKGKK